MITPSAELENEEFLQKTEEGATDYREFRSLKGSIEHLNKPEELDIFHQAGRESGSRSKRTNTYSHNQRYENKQHSFQSESFTYQINPQTA